MDVLIVGAGAVGQTYGRHLQAGGADVTFFVKPKHAPGAREGFTLYPLNGRRDPVRFEGVGVVTTVAEVAAGRWDQVWLAVSSPALRGAWLGDVISAAGDAVVVLLTPGMDDRRLIGAHVPDDRVVSGLISLIAYQAPLPGEQRFDEPGIAFWFPPMGPSPFSGPRAAEVVAALRAGGQPAKTVADVTASAPFASAALMPILLALEAADWQFDRLARGDHLARACAAVAESMAIVSRALGRKAPTFRHAVRPAVLRLVMALARRVLPLDIEVYLAYHFVKVGDQTRAAIARHVELGGEQGQSTHALASLLAGVSDAPGDAREVAGRVVASRSPAPAAVG